MTLQVKDNSETLNKKDIMISSIKASYNERLEKMSTNNIIKFDISSKETEELLKNNFDNIKAEASISIYVKASALN